MTSSEHHDDTPIVVEGQGDRLFLKGVGAVDLMEFYTSAEALSAETIDRWVDVLDNRRTYFADKGIAYQTLIVPDAQLVYRDMLPEGVQLAAQSPYEKLRDALDPETREQVVYPLDALVAGRERDETYAAVDSHWSDWGAWLGYQASIGELASRGVKNVQPLADSAVSWSSMPTEGALGHLMSPARSADVPIASVLKPGAVEKVRVMTESHQAYLVVEKNAKNLPTAVVFRDSFMTAAARFYAENFRRVVFVDSATTVFRDLIEREQPDVVIHEMCERSLVAPPLEPSPDDFRAAFGDLMLDNNVNSLAVTNHRLARHHPEIFRADVLAPIDIDVPVFTSVGLNYLLHCLPGTISDKGEVFRHLKPLLAPGGVIFGATLLHTGVVRSWPARRLMAFYNAKGIFGNAQDDLDGLRTMLEGHLDAVSMDVVGCVALFCGRAHGT